MFKKERNIEIEYNGKLLRLQVRQMRQLFDCILTERDTDAYKMLELFILTSDKEDNEGRILEAERQQEWRAREELKPD